jgi:predicted oxidoreductase
MEPEEFDSLLFSYHGIPERHIYKTDAHNTCKIGNCCFQENSPSHATCYRHQCYKTTELIREKTNITFNQIQFSATAFNAMTDGSLDYMQLHKIQPMAWNPLGTVFRENTEQTFRLRALLAQLVDKYGVGSDILLLAWIKQHPAGILPVAGTVNPGRIQQLQKVNTLKLELQDWFAIWTESMGSKVP